MALRRDDLEALRAAVRGAGLRATPSRIAVLHLLRSAGSPISHGDAVARLASQAWDPATIYRNLTDL
ncbi:MAG: transcriptional repressor, partial [Deltaproteobacteria bacterium]